MTSKLLFQNTFILRRPRVATFTDIIKIPIMFTKKRIEKLKTIKGTRNKVLKHSLYLYLLI